MSDKDIIVKDYDGNYLYPRAYKDYEGNVIHSTYVKGVKGNAETDYRTGNVNLTPANIGAVNKTGDTMTGNLRVVSAGEKYVEVKNSTTQANVLLDSNSTGIHGIWSGGYYTGSAYVTSSKWLLTRDTSGNVNIYGNADSATKLSTPRNIAFGADLQGNQNFDGSSNITINARTTRCLCDSGNVSNYPWHRIATVTLGTSSWQDGDCILEIRHRYSSGPCGRIKLSCRTNNATSSQAANVTAQWLYRSGISENAVVIALWGHSGQNVYADVYYSVATYARCIISKPYSEGPNEFQLINSSEVNDTTTSNKKGSYECYKTVAIAATELRGQAYTSTYTAVDAATVNNANNIKNKAGSYTTLTNALLDMVYPVGSIYMSVNSTSPQTFLGGTWARITDTFLYAGTSSGTYAPGNTGGSKTQTLQLKNYRKRLYIWQGESGGAGGTAILNGDYIGYGQNYNCWLTDSDNEAFSIMPPYTTVYMWKRTA